MTTVHLYGENLSNIYMSTLTICCYQICQLLLYAKIEWIFTIEYPAAERSTNWQVGQWCVIIVMYYAYGCAGHFRKMKNETMLAS